MENTPYNILVKRKRDKKGLGEEYEQYSSIERRAYVEKKQSKKTWMDRVKKYFQENRETIIAGLLSMNGDVNAYRMLEWKDK